MRLGQLSRKINVKPTDIIEYLDKDLKVKMNSHLNSKVEDQYVDLIISHFSEAVSKTTPKSEKETPAESKKEAPVKKAEKVSEKKEKIIKPEKEIEIVLEKTEEIEIETIKASAQKLDGLKVIGKIELPPPPPPEMIEIDGVMYDKQEVKKQRKEEKEEKEQRRAQLQKKKTESPNNPEVKNRIHPPLVKKHLSFEEKKEVDDKDYLKRKRADEKYQKEKQRKHYEKIQLLKPTSKVEKKKPTKKIKIQESEVIKESKPKPKSLLGKFWRWLNT